MGRSDCCQDKNTGIKVYAGSTLCGTWPSRKKNGWVKFMCPTVKATKIKIVQPNKAPLSLCGIEIYGEYTGFEAMLRGIIIGCVIIVMAAVFTYLHYKGCSCGT